MYAQFVTISRFDFAKVFAVLVVLASALALAPFVACPVRVAVASPGAMVCFIIANKAQSLLLHQQNVQLGERVDFLHVAACAMKYCK